MASRDKYYTGSLVSRYLPPGDRSWGQAVYQSSKPVLDSELILDQDILSDAASVLQQRAYPSGWLRGPAPINPQDDFTFPLPAAPTFVADAFYMRKRTAIVAGMPIVVEYTDVATAGTNLIQLDSAPVYGGAPPDVKRTDFVFLEVFLALVSDSPNATGTVQVALVPNPGDTVTINALPLTAVAGAPGVDQFTIGADVFTTAANIATALNDPANSFVAIVSGYSGGTDTVTITSVVSGAAGNAITLAATAPRLLASGANLAGGVDMPNKPDQDHIYRHGNVLAPLAVAFADDIADPVVGTETTKRVQIQYRIRTTGQSEAVNFKTESDGFSNANVLAQGTQAAPVLLYPFIPADNTTVSGNSDATAYAIEDPGLWIAGDGSSASATALGTVDGYVYAIPLCFVFRRNDAYDGGAGNGFDPINNSNGALPSTHVPWVSPSLAVLIPADTSDRPDRAFHDAIASGDLLDLRRHVVPGGLDFASELQYQHQVLLDKSMATWAIDAADKQTLGAGSGDVSWRFLVCNEIGREAAVGGNPPASGDTNRGVTIRNFDHVARRFGDNPVVEFVTLSLLPTDTVGAHPGKYNDPANVGYAGWAEDDIINIDLGTLNASTMGDWDPAGITFAANVSDLFPAGTVISNIARMWHDDGHYVAAVNQNVIPKLIAGIGTDHVQITLDANDLVVNGGDPGNPDYRMVGDVGADDGSPRRIMVQLEISYPIGVGTTDTPDQELSPAPTVYPYAAMLENDQTQRPGDWETLEAPRFREGKREIQIEYIANLPGSGIGSGTPIADSIVSLDDSSLIFPSRVFGSGALLTGVTDSVAAQPHDIDASNTEYGSSSQLVVLDTSGGPPTKQPLSGAGQTLCAITYFSQDAIPNYGAAGGGYQVAVYFRTQAPQTAGVMAGGPTLPDPITVRPLTVPEGTWVGTVGTGSMDIAFPYAVPMDSIPVNATILPASYPGEWCLATTALISVADFEAGTGLLNLHSMVMVDRSATMTFNTADQDIEFRSHYTVADTTAYRPTTMAQPLSGVACHKVWTPVLVSATADSILWRKGEVLLMVLTRFAQLDEENNVIFADTGNVACAGIYRTRGLLLITATE